MWSILLNMQESARNKADAPPALFGVGWHGQRFMLFLWPPNGPGLFFPEPVLVLQLQFCTCLWLEGKGGTFLFFCFARRNRLPSSWKGCMELILPGSLSNNRKALVPSTSLGNSWPVNCPREGHYLIPFVTVLIWTFHLLNNISGVLS